MTIVSRKPAPISTELEKGLLRSIFTIYWYRCGWFITKASGLALGILILFFNAATLTAAWADSGCTGLSALSQTYTVTNGVWTNQNNSDLITNTGGVDTLEDTGSFAGNDTVYYTITNNTSPADAVYLFYNNGTTTRFVNGATTNTSGSEPIPINSNYVGVKLSDGVNNLANGTVVVNVSCTPPASPILGVAMTHSGAATQGGTFAYTITPSATVAATSGTLTATWSLPAGLTYGIASGTGWNCSSSGCTSPTSIAAGTNGNPITLNVNVANTAEGPLTPSATLSGGGASSSATGNDSGTTITQVATHFSVVLASYNIPVFNQDNVTTTALDAAGQPVIAYQGPANLTSADASIGFYYGGQATAFSNGVSTFGAFAGNRPGSGTITATDASLSSVTGVSATVTITPQPLSNLVVSVPGNATKGTSFQFTVTAEDQYGDVETSLNDAVSFTSSDGAAVVPSGSLTAGVGTFTATLNTVGNQTITAKDVPTPSVTGVSGTIVVAAALTTTQAVGSTTLDQGVLATTFTPVTASGGTMPYGFAISGGSLPNGLNFSLTTGRSAARRRRRSRPRASR